MLPYIEIETIARWLLAAYALGVLIVLLPFIIAAFRSGKK